jgi:hypothetical protein
MLSGLSVVLFDLFFYCKGAQNFKLAVKLNPSPSTRLLTSKFMYPARVNIEAPLTNLRRVGNDWADAESMPSKTIEYGGR